jgi:hypothetical protein
MLRAPTDGGERPKATRRSQWLYDTNYDAKVSW